MSSKVGLWIDHRRAFIVYFEGDETASETILSNLEKHVRATRGSRSSTPYGPQDVIAGDRVDRKFERHLKQYYKSVAQALRDAESIFIMGPGEAKDELRKYLQESMQEPKPIITIETTDKMTDAQILSNVKDHYAR